jgi:hypothetical protein
VKATTSLQEAKGHPLRLRCETLGHPVNDFLSGKRRESLGLSFRCSDWTLRNNVESVMSCRSAMTLSHDIYANATYICCLQSRIA